MNLQTSQFVVICGDYQSERRLEVWGPFTDYEQAKVFINHMNTLKNSEHRDWFDIRELHDIKLENEE